MTDDEQLPVLVAGRTAGVPGVLAVTLGGSRAQGRHRPDSDWDFGLYYRGRLDPPAVVETAHARLAADGVWALNEKGMVEQAGLGHPVPRFVHLGRTPRELRAAVEEIGAALADADLDRPG